MTEAPDLTPREALQRYLDKHRVNRSEASISTYYYRLKLFVEWAEENRLARMSDVSGWDLESYEAHRRSKNPTSLTLNKEFGTLREWLRYLADIEVVDEDLPSKVHIPDVPADEKSSDIQLEADDARRLLTYYRTNPEAFGTRAHVLLELAWHTGARAGALRALDVQDMRERDGARYLVFRNRPETDTRLKKGPNGERPVLLRHTIWEALDHFVEHERYEVNDDHGREPLLAARLGRPSTGTIRDWMYLATIPCIHSECPHGKDPESCDWTTYSHASKCPSSRSPHQVRTGAITWMRNRGVPAEVVAERVNSGVDTIEQHYDKEDPVTEMLERRREHVDGLDIDDEDTDHD